MLSLLEVYSYTVSNYISLYQIIFPGIEIHGLGL